MKITYDPEADALYIALRDAPSEDSVDIEEGVTADLDAEGHIVGLELLDAREWRPEQAEEGIRLFRGLSLVALQVLPGFRGAYLLVDREKGRGEGISFWDTETHARDANAAVKDVRTQVSQELGVEPEISYYE